MSRGKLNLLLLVVAVALGIGVWLSQEKEEKGPPLTTLDPDAVTQIEVAHPDQPLIKLEKRGEQWFMTSPVEVAADKFEVNGILALADLELQPRFDEGVELEALELSPPLYTVTLDQTQIRIGGKEPIQHRRYVAVNDIVGVVADPPSAALDVDYSDLVSRRVVPPGADIMSIALPGFSVRKAENGDWSSPEHPQASTEQLSRLVDAWQDARALWNAALDPDAEQSDAQEKIGIELGDGRSLQLSVHARDPQLMLSNAALGVRYTLSKALEKELLALPAGDAPADAED